ncbi:MAG: branched-chain amino acid aminotransferase [Promethearchaeota archaeon]
MELNIELIPEEKRRKLPEDETQLGFGTNFTDHMFSMHYHEERGWFGAKIGPYSIITLDPASLVLHYGQEIFEGLKAYRGKDGKIALFRPRMNLDRMNNSAARLCMPEIDADFVLDAIKQLVEVEQKWVPHEIGTSLYIRPTYIATQAILGVRPSNEYLFYVILSPVGAYYATGFNPVKILVEEKYVRAAPGGVGFVKAGGNYASSLLAAKKAKEMGYAQVLWLDAAEHKYVEEVGTMNMFFKIDGKVITSPLTGSILPGITRNSVLHMLKDWGVPVEERLITIEEVVKANASGTLEEAFGSGTAAVITPVGELCYKDNVMVINESKVGELSQKLYDALFNIQYGKKEDPYGWRVEVC